MGMPDLDLLIAGWWGDFYTGRSLAPLAALAANMQIGTNPPYVLFNLATFYPKWFGPTTTVALALTAGSITATLGAGTTPPVIGALLNSSALPSGTFIANVVTPSGGGTTTVTLSQPASSTVAAVVAQFATPLVPFSVLTAYAALASSRLPSAKWGQNWLFGMALFISHFATLWLKTEGNSQLPAGAAAASALQVGIKVSKNVGGESVGYQPVTTGFESWGMWQGTDYGVQLIEIASMVGWGIVVLL